MSIQTCLAMRPLGREEFGQLDFQVMCAAFECQNQLGRLCDEIIYQNDLEARLQAAGIAVEKEAKLTITYRDFAKTYWLDLVVRSAAIYELKVSSALVREHDAQLLNYLFLSGTEHGKLINFRPSQVESRFVNATMSPEQRRTFTVETVRWREPTAVDGAFREMVVDLLRDWGIGLEVSLYTEAISYLFGGADQLQAPVQLARDGVSLGQQRFHLLTPDTAFRITALTVSADEYEHNLVSLLGLSSLRAIQWVNLARNRVQFVSLLR